MPGRAPEDGDQPLNDDMVEPDQTDARAGVFFLKVLGRTFTHLGVQMYKRRDTAIAELVANCWDAGAKNVYVDVPFESDYNQKTSVISIRDDGSGMTRSDIQDGYLVVGRDRREASQAETSGRPVMGRKGIGKLAGFGLALRMSVLTWRDGTATEFTLDVDDLTKQDNEAANVEIEYTHPEVPDHSDCGTIIDLRVLKHKSPIALDKLREALARRFSRRVRGEMNIHVKNKPLGDPQLDLVKRCPEHGHSEHELGQYELKYYYGFSKSTIRNKELRGFTIYVRGKTAQAPPFFFDVEGTASGQHGTKYVTGEIEADFLDEFKTNDLIATDRQEIDWEAEEVKGLLQWGQSLARRALREWRDSRARTIDSWLLADSALQLRINDLDPTSQKQVRRFLGILGQVDEAEMDEVLSLSDSIVQAFEFRHFHDVIQELESATGDPEEFVRTLQHLRRWQVLESRAILEIVKGRLDIVTKFRSMIVNMEPERASGKNPENLHDLLASYPWLLNPEWQVLYEEKSISKQLRDWDKKDTGLSEEELRSRYDFLALKGDDSLLVVDIKRPGHAVELDELHRLQKYKNALEHGTKGTVQMVMVCSGQLNVSPSTREEWKNFVLEWGGVFERARRHYEHYRDVLERNITGPGFDRKVREVQQTRKILETGARRTPADRRAGLGPQDVDYTEKKR